jgi:hypothetical protein
MDVSLFQKCIPTKEIQMYSLVHRKKTVIVHKKVSPVLYIFPRLPTQLKLYPTAYTIVSYSFIIRFDHLSNVKLLTSSPNDFHFEMLR